MAQEYARGVNAATAKARAIACSSMEIRFRCEKTKCSDGKPNARGKIRIPFAELDGSLSSYANRLGASGAGSYVCWPEAITCPSARKPATPTALAAKILDRNPRTSEQILEDSGVE